MNTYCSTRIAFVLANTNNASEHPLLYCSERYKSSPLFKVSNQFSNTENPHAQQTHRLARSRPWQIMLKIQPLCYAPTLKLAVVLCSKTQVIMLQLSAIMLIITTI